MTVEELYKHCVMEGYEDKEIKINVTCRNRQYSKYDISLDEYNLIFLENVEILVDC